MLTALLAVLAVAVVYCCALREAGHVVTESDAASMALQGWAVAHGNPLLHGWRLAVVSFYSIEVPEYALAGLIIGLRPDLVPVVAAATFTILRASRCRGPWPVAGPGAWPGRRRRG